VSGRSLSLGQYYPATSPLHALDPRVKIVLVLALVVSLFFIDQIALFGPLALLVLVLSALAGLPYGWVWRSVKPLLVIVTFTLLIHVFLTPGAIWFRLGPATATWTGLQQGLFFSFRLLLIITFSSFITLTTTPVRLADAIESLLSPLRVVRFPVHDFALMMTIALRFIPTLLEEAETIMKAQKARGADFESGNILRRTRNFLPLLVPLFIGSFRRADELALAMEARGYAGGEGRTRLHVLRLQASDALWLVGGLAVIVVLLAVSWLT
jgi:energy-coupling factor transport system permease protein